MGLALSDSMPENEYIRYRQTLIRNTRIGVSLYLNFFHEYVSHRKGIPSFFQKSYVLIKFFLLRFIFVITHVILRRNIVRSQEDFLIKREGIGKIKSNTFLFSHEGALRIRRDIESQDAFQTYKAYYQQYHANASRICLPQALFDETTQSVTTDFIPAPKLLNLFYDTQYGFGGVIEAYKDICGQLDILHGEQPVGLVHGDFSVVNILVDADRFFLIDYLDSFVYKKKYDKYLLLRSIFKFFGRDINFVSFCEYLPMDAAEFDEFEKVYMQRREMKQ